MKRATYFILALVLIPLLCSGITGCCGTQLKALADGSESSLAEVLREYEEIVIDGKPRPPFNESDKVIRRSSIAKFRELQRQARK